MNKQEKLGCSYNYHVIVFVVMKYLSLSASHKYNSPIENTKAYLSKGDAKMENLHLAGTMRCFGGK